MADIFHDLVINASRPRVFAGISTPAGLDIWWTKTSSGEPKEGAEYTLFFGSGYHWRAKVTRSIPDSDFELLLTQAHPDWMGSRVGFRLESTKPNQTQVHFHHTGWPQANEHWRISCYCWAMYLRILKRNLEHGETVPYEKRLDV